MIDGTCLRQSLLLALHCTPGHWDHLQECRRLNLNDDPQKNVTNGASNQNQTNINSKIGKIGMVGKILNLDEFWWKNHSNWI
jgi:hypothetical protein